MWVLVAQDLGGRKAPPGAPVAVPPSDDSSLAPFVPWALGLLALTTVAAWGGIVINEFSTAPCALQPEGCTEIPIWMKGAAREMLCCMDTLAAWTPSLKGSYIRSCSSLSATHDIDYLCMQQA